MAHRALVFYERPDGDYAIHYSHWGAADFRLQTAITERTPYGGRQDEGYRRWLGTIWRVLDLDLDILDDATSIDPATPLVKPDPIGTTPSLGTYVQQFDFGQYEAGYVVSLEYTVTTFLPLWFGVHVDEGPLDPVPTVGNGALVAFDPATEADWLRGWADGISATLAELVRTDQLDLAAVPSVFATVVSACLASDRTVHVAIDTTPSEEDDSG
ncbi:MAG: DUF6735 family protein [Halobacteriales archaeon]|nr:DUF6735 family protein [Halobacteriales archaeon]